MSLIHQLQACSIYIEKNPIEVAAYGRDDRYEVCIYRATKNARIQKKLSREKANAVFVERLITAEEQIKHQKITAQDRPHDLANKTFWHISLANPNLIFNSSNIAENLIANDRALTDFLSADSKNRDFFNYLKKIRDFFKNFLTAILKKETNHGPYHYNFDLLKTLPNIQKQLTIK